MRQTFTWMPEFEASLQEKPRVNVTKFGDGYEQRTPQGINNNPQKWSLQFSSSNASFPEILAFLRTHNGATAFDWTNPLEEEGVYVCREWKLSRKMGVNVITMDFEQVFEA